MNYELLERRGVTAYRANLPAIGVADNGIRIATSRAAHFIDEHIDSSKQESPP